MKYGFLLRLASLATLSVLISASSPGVPSDTATKPAITVFKDPNCGCCRNWVEHLKKHGFAVTTRDTSDMAPVKRTGRVPEHLQSCHTAFVNGYVIEGHVAADDIKRLLAQKPKIAGLAVPGMPAGSPGMEMGSMKDKYEVVAYKRDGSSSVFARH